jgi:hypothetical protein
MKSCVFACDGCVNTSEEGSDPRAKPHAIMHHSEKVEKYVRHQRRTPNRTSLQAVRSDIVFR